MGLLTVKKIQGGIVDITETQTDCNYIPDTFDLSFKELKELGKKFAVTGKSRADLVKKLEAKRCEFRDLRKAKSKKEQFQQAKRAFKANS